MTSSYDDDWGEGEALATEGTGIVSDAHHAAASAITGAASADDIMKDDSPTQSRAERLQAKMEREAAARSGRGSDLAWRQGRSTTGSGSAASASATSAAAGSSSRSNDAHRQRSGTQSPQPAAGADGQRIVSPDERLAAKVAAGDAAAAAASRAPAPSTPPGAPPGARQRGRRPAAAAAPVAPEDRLAAKIRREAAAGSGGGGAAGTAATRTTVATAGSRESGDSAGSGAGGGASTASETSDRIQARLREGQRRAQASYTSTAGGGRRGRSAASWSASSTGSTSGVPGVTVHGPNRTGGGGGGAADGASAKASAKGGAAVAADAATPDDRLRSKVMHQSSAAGVMGLGSIREDRAAVETTPDDRLQSKMLRGSAAQEDGSTPEDRLQAKLRGAASVTSDGPGVRSSVDSTPDDRLVAKMQRDSTSASRDDHVGTGKDSRYAAAGGAAAAAAAVATVGAVAVRGAQADAYGAGIEDPNEPSPLSDEAQDGEKKEESTFCGMSKRMAIMVGAAVLVIIVAAAAGGAAAAAAGGSNSSSPGSDESGSNTAPTDLPTPSGGSAPTLLPTLAPTKFIPPECQLNMLPKGEGTIGDFQESDQFGSSVAVSGDTAIVGAPLSSKGGSVHLYLRGDDYAWVKSAIVLKASDAIGTSLFGKALAIHGNAIAVGALVPNPVSEFGDSERVGCVYVFIREADGSWVEETRLLSNDPSSSDASFGSAVAIYEDSIVVGEPDGSSLPLIERTGSIYIFERRAGEGWVQTTKLRPEDGNTGDNFGNSVDVSGSSVVVGAVKNDASGKDSGVAYAYSKVDETWALKSKLLPADGSAFDSFGRSVAISADVVVIGARGDDDNGSSSGSTYVFVDNNGQWVEAAKLLAEDGEASDAFGKAVDVDGDFIVIGAEGADDDRNLALDNIGAVYVFERVGFSVWTQIRRIQPPGGDKDDAFGSSVATNDGTVVIGSLTSAFGLIEAGNAHIIEMC